MIDSTYVAGEPIDGWYRHPNRRTIGFSARGVTYEIESDRTVLTEAAASYVLATLRRSPATTVEHISARRERSAGGHPTAGKNNQAKEVLRWTC
nr:hypothetical protein [Rhodococcus sp. 06-621-2]